MREKTPFFVYGTLIPGQPGDAFWSGKVLSIEDAKFSNAMLYSLGEFPMMIEGDEDASFFEDGQADSDVYGKLITVEDEAYDSIVKRLDMYEGYDPKSEDESVYLRVKRWVTTASGSKKLAWAYIGKITYTRNRPIVPSGDWVNHIRSAVTL